MPAKAVAIQIWAFCASGRSSGFCVIIWLTCSGGILVGHMVGAKMRSAWDGSGLCLWPVLEAGQGS